MHGTHETKNKREGKKKVEGMKIYYDTFSRFDPFVVMRNPILDYFGDCGNPILRLLESGV